MLADFQQALADHVASPALCRKTRAEPLHLRERYALDEREFSRLVAMVGARAMAVNCMLYRANRLAPLALNLPRFTRTLGPKLADLLTLYAEAHPHTNVHFYVECDRFCRFVDERLGAGLDLDEYARRAFEEDWNDVKLHLIASATAI